MISRMYGEMPKVIQPIFRKWGYLLYPGVSWRKRQLVDEATQEFVARNFDDQEEFESYRSEFYGGRIVDICTQARQRVADDVTIYDAHHDECSKLYALIRKYQPTTIVETGVYHGVSTASILLALDRNGSGMLYSIDNSPNIVTESETDESDYWSRFYRRGRPSCSEEGALDIPRDRDPGWIIPTDLTDRWELRIGRSQRMLPPLVAELESIDLFLHDSEHSTTGMLFEFETAWEWLIPGGVIVSFHVDWNDAFDTFVEERLCEHGLMSYTYNGFSDFEHPCRSAYAKKSKSADHPSPTRQ